jgi:hypothetical protein
MTQRIARIDVDDGLAFPSGQVHPGPQRVMIFCRLPESWLAGDSIPADKLELVLVQLYGATWRQGNSDGSRYVVRQLDVHALGADELKAQPWLASPATGIRVLCYDASDGATVRRVQPADLS